MMAWKEKRLFLGVSYGLDCFGEQEQLHNLYIP